jgi:hypothetical protein
MMISLSKRRQGEEQTPERGPGPWCAFYRLKLRGNLDSDCGHRGRSVVPR